MISFTTGIIPGVPESSEMPRPTSRGTARGLLAISPQTVTGSPWRAPARAVRSIRVRTAGCSGS